MYQNIIFQDTNFKPETLDYLKEIGVFVPEVGQRYNKEGWNENMQYLKSIGIYIPDNWLYKTTTTS
jgi:hypothetical protein